MKQIHFTLKKTPESFVQPTSVRDEGSTWPNVDAFFPHNYHLLQIFFPDLIDKLKAPEYTLVGGVKPRNHDNLLITVVVPILLAKNNEL